VSHTIRLTQNSDKTWNYSCSCGKVRKNNLKKQASATVIHNVHVRNVNAAKARG
jgi:hypothetical protein